MEARMHLRNRHIACLLLLLSSLSAGEGSQPALLARWGSSQARFLRRTDLTLGGRYICSLLIQMRSTAAVALSSPLARSASSLPRESMALAPAHRELQSAAWAMYPPAQQSAALQAVTSRRA